MAGAACQPCRTGKERGGRGGTKWAAAALRAIVQDPGKARHAFSYRPNWRRRRAARGYARWLSEVPALRVGDQEVAKHLDTGDRLQLLRIYEVCVERERLGLAEQLHQPAVLFHQVIRQHRDAEATLTSA